MQTLSKILSAALVVGFALSAAPACTFAHCANVNDFSFEALGCDPCDPNVGGYDPNLPECLEQQGAGETGDGDGDGEGYGAMLNCSEDPSYRTFCEVAPVDQIFTPEGAVTMHSSECPSFGADAFPCDRQWHNDPDDETMCHPCNWLDDKPDAYEQPFQMYWDPTLSRMLPAVVAGAPEYMWIQTATLLGDLDYDYLGPCAAPVHIDDGSHGARSYDLWDDGEDWTCACYDDSDCPGDTVCESGYMLPPGEFIPQPTLCNGRDQNNALQPGPKVYGVQSFEDLVEVSNGTSSSPITWTFHMPKAGAPSPSEARGLGLTLLGPGLLNDDQRFDTSAVLSGGGVYIERCPSGALCEYLGLSEGDSLDLGVSEIDALERVGTVDFTATLGGERTTVRAIIDLY